jgi:hypothetical protein
MRITLLTLRAMAHTKCNTKAKRQLSSKARLRLNNHLPRKFTRKIWFALAAFGAPEVVETDLQKICKI